MMLRAPRLLRLPMKSLRLITTAAASLSLCVALNAPAFAGLHPTKPQTVAAPGWNCGAPILGKISTDRQRFSATLSEWAINALIAKPTDADPLSALTQRERPVLPLAAEGHSNPEVAENSSSAPAPPRPIAPISCANSASRRRPTSSASPSAKASSPLDL